MKILVAIVGLVLLAGCASTPPPEPVAVVAPAETIPLEAAANEVKPDPRAHVQACIVQLMDKQAHVLDATESCLRVYANIHLQRTQRQSDE